MNKKITLLFSLFMALITFSNYSCAQTSIAKAGNGQINIISDIPDFNALNAATPADASVNMVIKQMTDIGVVNKIVKVLSGYENRIVHLHADMNNYTLTIGYVNDLKLVDIMQILYANGYYAHYFTAQGKEVVLDANGNLEEHFVK